MAIVRPTLDENVNQNGGQYRERQVIENLSLSLPDSFEIFHNIDWVEVGAERDHFGEVDVVVMFPDGHLVILEVKAGDVEIRDERIYKHYSDGEKDVAKQSMVQRSAIINGLKKNGIHVNVINCLVLPDFKMPAHGSVSFPRERIFDANDYEELGSKVKSLFAIRVDEGPQKAVRNFLLNIFYVEPDLSVLNQQLQKTVQRISDGMATWVPRINSPSDVIRINGTAGSGKTQLAIKLLNDAAVEGRKSLYVCYNRSLSDAMNQISPSSAHVSNFHELARDMYLRHFSEIDFSQSNIFEVIADFYIEKMHAASPIYDLIIIDEAQDFDASWVAALISVLKEQGKLYILEDANQQVYERDEFDLADAVTLDSMDNFRTPSMLVRFMNAFHLTDVPVSSKNLFKGDLPKTFTYNDEQDLKNRTIDAIQDFIDRGFSPDEIAVITFRGRANSELFFKPRIGRHSAKYFKGTYNKEGNPEWTDGEILIDTVYRFKGLSYPAVVITGVDFEEIDDSIRRRLFVAITRARVAASIVMTGRAESWFATKLSEKE